MKNKKRIEIFIELVHYIQKIIFVNIQQKNVLEGDL